MASRFRSIIIGAALGLAAMPVIMALAWGLLLASGCMGGVADINDFQRILPWAGLFSLLAALIAAIFLVYQGYRLDKKGLLSQRDGVWEKKKGRGNYCFKVAMPF